METDSRLCGRWVTTACHGQDDTVVPFEQSDLMLSATKKAHLSVELVKMKNEDHWSSRGETRLQTLQATFAFLKTNNPP